MEVAATLAAEGIQQLLPVAVSALESLISAQSTHFTTGVGYCPVRISIDNTTGQDYILSSLTVTSGKVVATKEGECPPRMMCVPSHQKIEWQVSTRVGALFGTEGSATYSSTDGKSWFSFTWDNPIATGSILKSTGSVGGTDPPSIIVNPHTTGGLHGLSVLEVRLTLSLHEMEELAEGIKEFAEGIKKEFESRVTKEES